MRQIPILKTKCRTFNLGKEETDLLLLSKPKGSLSPERWISCACASPDSGAQRGRGSSQGPIGGLCSYIWLVPDGKLLYLLKCLPWEFVIGHSPLTLLYQLSASDSIWSTVLSFLKTCCSFGWVKRWFISCPVGCQPALMILSARAHSCPGWREWQLGQPWGLDGPLSFKASGLALKPSSWFGVTICGVIASRPCFETEQTASWFLTSLCRTKHAGETFSAWLFFPGGDVGNAVGLLLSMEPLHSWWSWV